MLVPQRRQLTASHGVAHEHRRVDLERVQHLKNVISQPLIVVA